jgi:peroxiredoxin
MNGHRPTGSCNNFQRLFFVAVMVLLAAGISPPAGAAGMPLGEMKAARPAPDFTLPDLDGVPHTLSAYRGRVVMVNFWATWCPPCRKEIPSMQRAWKILKGQGVVMLAIHVGGDVEDVAQFTYDYAVEFPVLMDRDSDVIDAWPIRGLPTTIIVDKNGVMALQAIGSREWDDPATLKRILQLREE